MNPTDRAEISVVANTLEDPKCYDEAGLQPEQFHDPRLSRIWAVIGKLVGAGTVPDVLNVSHHLGDYLDAVGGLPFLTSLILNETTSIPVNTSAAVVREAWLQREIKLLGESFTLPTAKTGSELLRSLRKQLEDLEAKDGRVLPTLHDTYERERGHLMDDLATIDAGDQLNFGLDTGLGIEQVVPGGIPVGKVTALYGESGNFKTTTKNNIVWGVARLARSGVIDFSFEDSDQLTTQRFIAGETGVSYGQIATRNLAPEQRKAVMGLSEQALEPTGRIYMGGDIPPDIDEIIRISRFYARTHGVKLVVLDYIQLVSNEKEKLDRAMRLLQLSAKRDRLAYLVVSQVKQDVDFRASNNQDARPRITDMLGTSSFRTAPKLSLGVYRPYKYARVPSSKKTHRMGGRVPFYSRLVNEHPDGEDIYRSIIELWVQKNVLGEPEVCILLTVDPTTGKMKPLVPEIKDLLR